MATASSISSSETSSGGASRSAVGRHRVDDQPGRRGSAARPARPSRSVELGGEQQAEARAPSPTPGSAARPSASRSPGRRGAGGHVVGLHLVEHRAGRGGGERLAAEGRGVVAGLERGGHLGPGPAGADGHAVAEGLGHRDDVGHDAEVLEAEPPPGAAEAGLHLVDHEQDAPLVAQPAHAGKYSAVAGFTPPSPCTGSSSTAATEGSSAASSASRSSHATWRKPSGSGWNGSCFAGCPVACSVASVRPWNEPRR